MIECDHPSGAATHRMSRRPRCRRRCPCSRAPRGRSTRRRSPCPCFCPGTRRSRPAWRGRRTCRRSRACAARSSARRSLCLRRRRRTPRTSPHAAARRKSGPARVKARATRRGRWRERRAADDATHPRAVHLLARVAVAVAAARRRDEAMIRAREERGGGKWSAKEDAPDDAVADARARLHAATRVHHPRLRAGAARLAAGPPPRGKACAPSQRRRGGRPPNAAAPQPRTRR